MAPAFDARRLLGCATPELWYVAAAANLRTLLIDHANCEKKAAGTALSLLYRYVDKPDLLRRMSRLAREELRHYEQVLSTMDALRLEYGHLTPSRYAGAMRASIRTSEPGRLVDTLLVGAVVEARSCERFEGLADGSTAASPRSTVACSSRRRVTPASISISHDATKRMKPRCCRASTCSLAVTANWCRHPTCTSDFTVACQRKPQQTETAVESQQPPAPIPVAEHIAGGCRLADRMDARAMRMTMYQRARSMV